MPAPGAPLALPPIAPPDSAPRAAPEGLTALAAAVADCRRCQAAGLLPLAAPRLLGLARLLEAGACPPRPPRLVVVGQAPARHLRLGAEAATTPFVRAIAAWLIRAGFPTDDLAGHVHFSALTRCFPGPAERGDRAPSRAEIDLCRPHLAAELALLRPAVILPVGRLAIAAFAGRAAPLEAVVGGHWQRDGVRYLPLPHPSGVSRWLNVPDNQARVEQALATLATWRRELDL